jgi:hypothetical protein
MKGILRTCHTILILMPAVLSWIACGRHGDDGTARQFELLSPSRTGVHFANRIEANDTMNILSYQDFFSGGGVAIGDINGDSLPDLFFTGNQTANRLYLNKGGMVFEDITEQAGITDADDWCTGVTMIDINNDGLLDIYIARSGLFPDSVRRNLLYVNLGDLKFEEKAAAYGIDHDGYGVNACFLDYDRDGDLDMYLVNQGPVVEDARDVFDLRGMRDPHCGDVFFENVDGYYMDVTEQTGVYSSRIGFGHQASAADLDGDGWDDIYVSNDFFEHDYLYLNNGDKTFREAIAEATRHVSYSSMGNDVADFNNDTLPDVLVLDMIAEDNRRLKANLGGLDMKRFDLSRELGFHYQYMFNTLHLNNGGARFSEIAHLAGVPNTDWSWGPLFADFDNDGWKDLYIANGIRKDIRNIDWAQQFWKAIERYGGQENIPADVRTELLGALPSEKVLNYMYKNEGDLTFRRMNVEWGMEMPSFSNGAAYGDLDGDGDLDIVVNNVEDPAFIYQNNQDTKAPNNYLRIALKGPPENPFALGAKVKVYTSGLIQMQQHYLARGFRSSSDPVLVFGLGRYQSADSVEVTWYDGRITRLDSVWAHRDLRIAYGDNTTLPDAGNGDIAPLFTQIAVPMQPSYTHQENPFNDFMRQPLLPYRYSQLGPRVAVGDVNGDKLDDFYIGGALRKPGSLYVQDQNGGFVLRNAGLWFEERGYEDMGACFFDADQDGDLDLYVVSGGSELDSANALLQDRLYINDGAGFYTRSATALPERTTSGSVVLPADVDGDGDPDLFVGGRQVPALYPLPADSYLMINEGGVFVDETRERAPDLFDLGLVTDALWMDYDQDGDPDLFVAGEWMPVTIFINDGGVLVRDTTYNGLQGTAGWWYTLAGGDLDGDGDQDLVAGNLGHNTKYTASADLPFELYADDFDLNGTLDPVLVYSTPEGRFPVEGRNKLFSQLPFLNRLFPTYNSYAEARVDDLFSQDALQRALHLQASMFETVWFENMHDGTFKTHVLPKRAQISPVRTIMINDFNGDTRSDILLVGNNYGMEVESVRMDAGRGLLLTAASADAFDVWPPAKSGFEADADVRDMQLIMIAGRKCILVASNSDQIRIFTYLD